MSLRNKEERDCVLIRDKDADAIKQALINGRDVGIVRLPDKANPAETPSG